MGNTTSDIFEAMANVSKRLDHMALPEPISELEALALEDCLLATLRKAYLDARRTRLAAETEYGVDDGMTEMAALVEDSAWCAMQTRYLEVRDEKGAAERAARAIAQDQEMKREKQEREDREARVRLYQFLDALQTQIKREKDQDGMIWFVLAMMMLSRSMMGHIISMQPHYAAHRFNLSAA